MRDVLRQIESIGTRARLLLVGQRVCILLAWTIAAILALTVFDYFVRLPGTARFVIGLMFVGGLLAGLWIYLWPAVVFHPRVTDLALRVERLMPQLRGHLTSGVEFALAGMDRQSPLAAEAVAEAQQRVGRENLRGLVNPKRTLADAGVFAFAAVVLLAICFAAPASASIAAQRWLNPFGDAQWPKRTGIVSAMDRDVHPLGRALPLRAQVTKGLSDDMRVYAQYRLVNGEQYGRWEQVILTRQRDGLFERLIEPNADAIELRFTTDDDETPLHRIRLVPPPSIVKAEISVEPPAYAAEVISPLEVDLGPGTDDRAILSPPVLAGSTATLRFTFNKPLPHPEHNPRSETTNFLGWESEGEAMPTLEVEGEAAQSWTLTWTLDATARLNPLLTDEFGLTGPDDLFYRLEVVPDSPPTVAITQPAADHTYLPTAYVPLRAEARDDVLIGTIALKATPSRQEQRTLVSRPGAGAIEEIEYLLDLAMLDVHPGDVVEAIAVATDTYDGAWARVPSRLPMRLGSPSSPSSPGASHGLEAHAPVHSTPRRLRIISQAEFVEQVYQHLSAVRDDAIRLEQEQRELRERLERREVQPGDLREQARISQRLDRQQEAVSNVAQRLRDNRLGDRELESMVDEARSMLQEAGRASNEASESMAQSRRRDAETDEEAQRLREQTDQQQQRVSEELSLLIELLDRGQDAWVMRRQIEQMHSDQRDLEQRAREVTDQTRGREERDLSDAERRALSELAQQQDRLSDRAREMIDELRRRADEMQSSDPDLSSAMEQAASQAQSQRLEETMQDAAEQLQSNQGQRASQSQQSAMETLQSMLERLEQTERARAERLQRHLASLIDSIEALILDQEAQIDALAAAEPNFAALAQAMMILNTNTYSVADMASQGGRELLPVVRLLETAARAQEDAIGELRAETVSVENAREAEMRSLTALREAKDLAEELQQQLQEDETRRLKEELIRAYRDLYEREIALKLDTEPLAAEEELDRRQRVTARQLGNRQTQIREDAAELLDKAPPLRESPVFHAAHRQIDELAESVAEDLRNGRIGPAQVMRQQDLADRFSALAEALMDSLSEDEFLDSGGGGGDGGGGAMEQPLIPPVAQLKLLRAFQDSLYRATRSLDEAGAAIDSAARRARSEELGRSQKELTDLAEDLVRQMEERMRRPRIEQQPPQEDP